MGKFSVRIAGILFCIYGALVLSIIGAGHWFNYAFLIIGAVFIAVSLLWKHRLLRRIFIVLLAAALVVVGAFEVRVIRFSLSEPSPGADYIVILGCKLNGSEPSLEFSARINKAAEYLIDNEDCIAVTTGGRGSDESMAEGEAAKMRLIGRGIDESRIIVEDKSISTRENLALAKPLIEAAGGELSKDRVLIVSSYFHLYRASLYAASEGYDNTEYLGSAGLVLLMPHYYLREFAGCVREFVL